MNIRMAVVSSVALVLALVPLPAYGASTYHVDKAPRCSNSGPGSRSQPFCTIGQGAAVARPGDTVIVHGATYREMVTVPRSGTSRSPITFKARGRATVMGRKHGFLLNGRRWITIRGFAVTATSSHGIFTSKGSGITISRNDVWEAGQPVQGQIAQGIYLRGVTDSLVEGNSAHHNSNHGIELGEGTTKTTVRGNFVFNNARQYAPAAAGIQVFGGKNNVIEANRAFANEDSGFNVREGATDNLIASNASWGNGDHGFDTHRATGTRYIGNTAFGNSMDGLSVEADSTGTVIANCISVQNGRFELYVDSSSTPGFTSDYDVLWDPNPGPDIRYAGTGYDTVESFSTATSHDSHGIGADPMFANPTLGDFHLLPGSPAIDSANSGANGHLPLDLEGNPRVDDPAVSNSGIGPRPFDDRGAYERQV
jgi:parallel beta-helix repeat protein